MTQISPSIDAEYESGLKRYDEGGPLEDVLDYFTELHGRAPSDVRIAVSLSWLHILVGNKDKAIFFSREARTTAQGRFNLALAYLAFGEKGVREKFVDAVEQAGHDGLHDAIGNLEDAVKRKGGKFAPAEKMLKWIEEIHPSH